VDPETKKLLEETLVVNKENNVLLRKLLRSHKLATIYRVVYWALIILSVSGVYYFIQPLLGNMFNAYGVSGQGNISDVVKNLGSNQQQMQELFDSLK
jgi:hypothetical protein